MSKYDDIINLSRPMSKYPKISSDSRSAQFSPFAALSGYDEQIKETTRVIEHKKELSEEFKETIDIKLKIILKNIKSNPQVNIIYFKKDSKKDGGRYIEYSGNVKKIDVVKKLLLTDNVKIPVSDIIKITSEILIPDVD